MPANSQGLEQLTAAAEDTEKVKTRMAVMIPPPYVALLLQKQRRSPVEFWTDIVEGFKLRREVKSSVSQTRLK